MPGIFKHYSPTALTALVICPENTTSKQILTVLPVQHGKRKVPIEYKDEIEKDLGEMVQQGIIAKQTEPTPWVSSLTYPKKSKWQVKNLS